MWNAYPTGNNLIFSVWLYSCKIRHWTDSHKIFLFYTSKKSPRIGFRILITTKLFLYSINSNVCKVKCCFTKYAAADHFFEDKFVLLSKIKRSLEHSDDFAVSTVIIAIVGICHFYVYHWYFKTPIYIFVAHIPRYRSVFDCSLCILWILVPQAELHNSIPYIHIGFTAEIFIAEGFYDPSINLNFYSVTNSGWRV